MIEIVAVFIVVVVILLLVAIVSDRFGIGTRGGNPPAPTVPICGVPEPPPEYWEILAVLQECIKNNYLTLGICLPSGYPAQYCASPGEWVTPQHGRLIYWYVFDVNTSAGVPINSVKIANTLNEMLPAYCYYAGIPLFQVVVVRPLSKGRVAIGVVLS